MLLSRTSSPKHKIVICIFDCRRKPFGFSPVFIEKQGTGIREGKSFMSCETGIQLLHLQINRRKIEDFPPSLSTNPCLLFSCKFKPQIRVIFYFNRIILYFNLFVCYTDKKQKEFYYVRYQYKNIRRRK